MKEWHLFHLCYNDGKGVRKLTREEKAMAGAEEKKSSHGGAGGSFSQTDPAKKTRKRAEKGTVRGVAAQRTRIKSRGPKKGKD